MVKTERPIDIFKYPEIDKLLASEFKFQESKAIDLGCSIPMYLFELQLKYGFSKLVGIDILQNEKDIIDKYSYFIDNESFADCDTIKECHTKFVNHYETNTEKAKQLIHAYETTFKIFTNSNVMNIDLSSFKKFNLVFLVDILHFIPFHDRLRLIKEIPDMLTENGLIIIRAHHEQNASMTNPKNSVKIGDKKYRSKYHDKGISYLLDEKGFKKIISDLESNGISRMFNPEKYLNDNERGYKSMFYIGRKIIS